MRADLDIISQWIKAETSVLDLGCGDGSLLAWLRDTLQVRGIGLEIDDDNIVRCIEKDLNVIHSDLNDGLSGYFNDNSFDYAVMTQTLQAMSRPDLLLDEILRIAREGIITFPNMAHWKGRLQLALSGIMPVTDSLPNTWYDTPNIHLCTFNDFENLCKQKNLQILQREVVDHTHQKSTLMMGLFPNLFGEIAIYRISKR